METGSKPNGSFTPNHPPILATSLLCPNTKPSRPTSLPTSTNVPACTSKKRMPMDVLCSPLSKIDFVLSHPNGWEGKEQVKMRRAAVSAGFIDDTKRGHKRASLWMSCRRRNKQLQGRCQATQANFRRDGCPPVLRQLACPTVSRIEVYRGCGGSADKLARSNIKYVVLVGGLSADDRLFDQLNLSLASQSLTVICPESYVNKAVSDGAISFIEYFLGYFVHTCILKGIVWEHRV